MTPALTDPSRLDTSTPTDVLAGEVLIAGGAPNHQPLNKGVIGVGGPPYEEPLTYAYVTHTSSIVCRA